VATASVPKANPVRNLLAYTLKPEDMKGEELHARTARTHQRLMQAVEP
jgi:hypothetical protein